ncbi:uncharacterized protein LOC110991077 [Acanthaster planci]|uniref:Uncharacterized protein LOC110991077 n=1 Tax=Acanthaster planci TaxID=133434 RepID=A0A8B8A3F6_ACAPL|nr:uncharacterized protein LOC110991077 [Acanthaster planci]
MAVMKRCCCFNDTRSGTLASAICSLLYAIIFAGLAGASFAFSSLFLDGIVLVMYYVDFAIYGLVIVCAIIAIVGVSKDIAGMLLPYIIALTLMMVLELVSYIVWIAILGFAAILLIIPFVIWILLLALNIVCLLCAISQFQELKAGRGRIEDVQATHTTTIVMTGGPVVTNQPPPGTFVVTTTNPQVQAAPPAYGQPMGQPVGQPMIQPGYTQPTIQPGYTQPITLNQPDDVGKTY